MRVELGERAAPARALEVALGGDLREVRAAQVGRLLDEQHLGQDRLGRGDPAQPQPGREDLGERAQVDDLVVERAQRLHVPAVEAQPAVRVVLDHRDVVLARQLEQPAAALRRHRDAAGVLEVRDRVDELGAARTDALELGLEQVHAHAVVVHRHAADLGLVRRERLQRADVGGALGDDDVAGVQERLGEQVERLLGAGGDEQVARLEAHADLGHEVGDELARSASRPSLPPYWSAAAPSWMTASRAAVATASAGTRSTAGMPPESEIMSGREAAANRSRTALDRTPAMQSA